MKTEAVIVVAPDLVGKIQEEADEAFATLSPILKRPGRSEAERDQKVRKLLETDTLHSLAELISKGFVKYFLKHPDKFPVLEPHQAYRMHVVLGIEKIEEEEVKDESIANRETNEEVNQRGS